MRKILRFLTFSCMLRTFSFAQGQIATVDYVHQKILTEKGIDVGYNQTPIPELSSTHYLMRQIDRANEILNDRQTSTYAEDPQWMDAALMSKEGADKYIDKLIKYDGPDEFYITISGTRTFKFTITAPGQYTIDWGDGVVQPSTGGGKSHTYPTNGEYTITVSGEATSYRSASSSNSAITFDTTSNRAYIRKITGKMGRVFKTLQNGINPGFADMCYGCTNLTEISPDLFDGITGQPIPYMLPDIL